MVAANFQHAAIVGNIDKTDGDYAFLVHVPHADVLGTFLASVPHFLMNAQEYMYHGSGFDYSCTDGWLNASPDVIQSYSRQWARRRSQPAAAIRGTALSCRRGWRVCARARLPAARKPLRTTRRGRPA